MLHHRQFGRAGNRSETLQPSSVESRQVNLLDESTDSFDYQSRS